MGLWSIRARRMSRLLETRELRIAACELARIGADVAAAMCGKVTASRKADDTPVTAADHAAQDAILHEIARRFPDHGVIVEESLASPERHAALRHAEYCWVV